MSSTDHPVPGPDEAGGEPEPDPAASPSRARVAAHGWLPWTAGAVLAASQLLVLLLAPGQWRTLGAVGLAVVTLAGVGGAVFGSEGERDGGGASGGGRGDDGYE